MYLKDRRRVVLTHNPFMSMTDDTRPEYMAQVGPISDKVARRSLVFDRIRYSSLCIYFSEMWFDFYLKDRRRVALTHNPFLAWKNDPRPEYNDMVLKAEH